MLPKTRSLGLTGFPIHECLLAFGFEIVRKARLGGMTLEVDLLKAEFCEAICALKNGREEEQTPGGSVGPALDAIIWLTGLRERIEVTKNEIAGIKPATFTERDARRTALDCLEFLLRKIVSILPAHGDTADDFLAKERRLALLLENDCSESVPSSILSVGGSAVCAGDVSILAADAPTKGAKTGIDQAHICEPAPSPEALIARLQATGGIGMKELVAEVDRNFPNLSDAKLGELFPANPGAPVSWEARNSRGRRLRGKKK